MFEFRLSSDFNKKKVKYSFQGDIEPQEVFLDVLAKKKEEEFLSSEKKFEVPLLQKILQGFFVFSLLVFGFLFSKTFQMQVISGKELLAKAEENKYILRQIQAERGVIYDKDLNQLVFNRPSFDLVCQKNNLPLEDAEKEKILAMISGILEKKIDELRNDINGNQDPKVLIYSNLDHQKLIILESKIKELPGFQIENNTVREYASGELYAHLLGYMGRIKNEELKEASDFYSTTDYVGRDGLEKSYEEFLRKNPGKLRVERDVSGNIISKEVLVPPGSGNSLVLWIDSNLQEEIKKALENGFAKTGTKKAVAVALNPKTGAVLSLVSLPSYDNNLFQKNSSQEALSKVLNDPLYPLFNRATSGQYPTGSTIKPIVASAALEEKIISPDKQINCKGVIEVEHWYNPDIIYKFRDWSTHGWTNLKKAIAESCDVYFYTIGGGYKDQKGLGPSLIKKYLEYFGWGKKTQIDLPSEGVGLIPSPEWKKTVKKESWVDGDTYHMSIGQGDVLATPLQVAASFVPIANGGKLLKPQIVHKIIDSQKNIIKEFQPEILSEVPIDPENLQIVREGMRQAVTGRNSPQASSILLNSLPVAAAAKTGTAETGKMEKGQEIYHNWIAVFAPYDDPQIVLTIMFENVKGQQTAALPVAKEVLQWYFSETRSQ